MAELRLEGVSKSFGAVDVLRTVDLTVADGEMLVIVGASGCGKSTLLRLVAGLEATSRGRISIDGRDVTHVDPAERDIAMVFQNYALYPHMTVFDNMAYGLRIRGMARHEIRSRVTEAAGLLGLEALLDRRPRQLSGGQRQRVAMGRAIVRQPKLFLFDEPLSNLDASLRVQMRAEILRLQRRLGVTSLYVTHDQVEAMTLGDRLLVLHQGRPAQLASPMAVWSKPADTYVAGFIGAPAMNFLSAEIAPDGQRVQFVEGAATLPGRYAPGRVTLGIRPEHVVLEPAGVSLAVELVEKLGSETLVHGRLADGTPLQVKLTGAVPIGDRIAVRLLPEMVHVFDARSGARIAPSVPD